MLTVFDNVISRSHHLLCEGTLCVSHTVQELGRTTLVQLQQKVFDGLYNFPFLQLALPQPIHLLSWGDIQPLNHPERAPTKAISRWKFPTNMMTLSKV